MLSFHELCDTTFARVLHSFLVIGCSPELPLDAATRADTTILQEEFQKRSIVEVHPELFSEASHLRSSIPHPKTDFSKN